MQNTNKFLFLAYSLVWIVFMLYAWRLARRQSRLAKELADLKRKLPANDEGPAAKL